MNELNKMYICEATAKDLGEKTEFASTTEYSWVILVLPFCIFRFSPSLGAWITPEPSPHLKPVV